MIYFTSDLHFGHSNIIKYCNRPYPDVDIMNKQLTDNWNSIIFDDDTVYDLGDFAFNKPWNRFQCRLNGNIVHIRGNHDKVKNGLWLENCTFKYGGLYFYLTHRPLTNIPDTENKIDVVICGHVHGMWKGVILEKQIPDLPKQYIPQINVGVDVWDYQPVSIDTIIRYRKELLV